MGFFTSAVGAVQVEIVSADIPSLLRALDQEKIPARNVKQIGALSIQLEIARVDFKRLKLLTEKRGESLRLKRRLGMYWTGKRLLRRPVLLIGVLLLVCWMMFLPTRIFFVRVEGNVTVPARKIIEQAELCGIRFGASRREVRSEKVKNALLSALPQLQWAAVNTSGCVATVSVRERSKAEDPTQKVGISSIVAARDGVVVSCTATKGSLLCKPGQAVRAGEVLVSGYTDCGLRIQATRAQGEVYARTQREIAVIFPLDYDFRGEIRDVETRYGLLIGKKHIKFFKDSGISHSSCDKMYAEHFLELPGGFRLPLAITVERIVTYEPGSIAQLEAEDMLRQFAEQYLSQQMISGNILSRTTELEQADRVLIFRETAICQEMIGRERNEEWITDNEQIYGTNRERRTD